MHRINDHILGETIWITDTIPLNVYLVHGSQQAVFIDSGIKSMHPQLMKLLRKQDTPLQAVLHTHSHHDHIGSSGQMKDVTGCQIISPKAYAHWHNDWDVHYQEFARPFPSIFPDTPELREEVLGILDAPHKVDKFCQEGDLFDLGGNVQLKCLAFSGHMLEEVGWLELKTKTLVLGDVVTLIDAPFIHGHLTVQGYRQSLQKLRAFINTGQVATVLMAHFPPMDPRDFLTLIKAAEDYIQNLENTILSVIRTGLNDLQAIWLETLRKLDKIREFRSLSTIDAHLKDLHTRSVLKYQNQQIVR